jgi:hypothetical protein
LIQCGQLDLHGLNEFILLREGVVFHVLCGLFRFSLNLVNLLRVVFSLSQPTTKAAAERNVMNNFFFSMARSID